MFEGEETRLKPLAGVVVQVDLLRSHLGDRPQLLSPERLLSLAEKIREDRQSAVHFMSSSHGLQGLIIRFSPMGALRQGLPDLLLPQGSCPV